MAKYTSNRQKNLKVGISSYSENLTSLEVIGNVGIGTTNPTSALYVVGDTYITGILTANRLFSSIYGEFFGGSISGTSIVGTSLSISGISTLGNVRISSGIITAVSGIVTYYGDGAQLTGISAGSLSISTNTTNQAQYIPYATSFGSTTGLGATTSLVYNPSTGNLGIGTTNPTQPLHVQGNARVTGAVYDSTNSPGLSGQVLQSSVTGALWTTTASAEILEVMLFA